MKSYLIKNGQLVNEGITSVKDVWIKNGRIQQIDPQIVVKEKVVEIDAEGSFVLPGIIDDQVHFRQPGYEYKANIYTESRAAVAGGVTSFMEMPNTKPTATTQDELAKKYAIAAQDSMANYSFFMGATNDNLEEVLKTNSKDVCGIKVFMGSSTGNMLVDDMTTLDGLFKESHMLIAAHCEDETTVRRNTAAYLEGYGNNVPISCHPEIRNHEACYLSSSRAVELAKKHNTRFHVLHISTKEEVDLFRNDIPLKEKRITAEVCVHHLSFNNNDYVQLGSKIKCNPAIKTEADRLALWSALLDDHFDIIATDHAPHTLEEKNSFYPNAPSGLPLVQHSWDMMMGAVNDGILPIEKVVEKMCHAPADCFQIQERGYLKEGYWADLFIYNPKLIWNVHKSNLLYKCGWSPLEGRVFNGKITETFVSGKMVYDGVKICSDQGGQRLLFN